MFNMKSLITILILIISPSIFSQDGSDILYGNPEILNNTHIGKLCHIDFGKKSSRSLIKSRDIDTIQINVKGKTVSFIEHRVDNHFNNWFSQQYLEALPLKKDSSMRLTSSKIDSLTPTKVYVTSVIGYYNYNSPIDTITIIHHSYLRKNIAQILFKSKQFHKE